MSRDSLRTLAEGFGLRLNHHNVGNLIDACRMYDREDVADYLEKELASNGEVTRSCWIGPFIDRPKFAAYDAKDNLSVPIGSIIEPWKQDENGQVFIKPNSGIVIGDEYAKLSPENPVSKMVSYKGPVRLDFHELQLQQFAWVNHNFPDQLEDPLRQDDSFLGMVEELGEIARSLLKLRQGIRGTEEKWLRERKDGVGDLVIFLCSFCNSYGLSLQECVEVAWAEVRERDWKKYPNTGRPALG